MLYFKNPYCKQQHMGHSMSNQHKNIRSTFWLNVSYNSGTLERFIHHPFCPLDYCTSESKYINLNDPDKQCNVNRSGLLCGKCKKGLSLVLGSSQCKECRNNYLALFIPFALVGYCTSRHLALPPPPHSSSWDSPWTDLLCQHCGSKPSHFLPTVLKQPSSYLHSLAKPGSWHSDLLL